MMDDRTPPSAGAAEPARPDFARTDFGHGAPDVGEAPEPNFATKDVPETDPSLLRGASHPATNTASGPNYATKDLPEPPD